MHERLSLLGMEIYVENEESILHGIDHIYVSRLLQCDGVSSNCLILRSSWKNRER